MSEPVGPEVCQTSEGQLYLDRFKGLEADRFAVIKIGGGLIQDGQQLDLISGDVAVLRSLGLFPSIVHGAGPQIDNTLRGNGFNSNKNGGIRLTKPEHMPYVSMAIKEAGLLLSSGINEAIKRLEFSGSAKNLEYLFTVTLADEQDMGSVNEVMTVGIDEIGKCISKGKVPVISSVGELAVNNETEVVPVNVNADIAAAALARVLEPEKYISLTKTGAVLDANGRPISKMTAKEARSAIANGLIKDGMKVKVEEGLGIIEDGVQDFVITSPKYLLKELFTSEGSGTLIAGED